LVVTEQKTTGDSIAMTVKNKEKKNKLSILPSIKEKSTKFFKHPFKE